MIKYLVFKNDPSGGKFSAPGSPEDIAVEIVTFVEMLGSRKIDFICYPADSSDATFASIKRPPQFSLELDQEKIKIWINDAKPLIEKLYDVTYAIEGAYTDIAHSIHLLKEKFEASPNFSDIDLVEDVDISIAFEEMERPSENQFAKHIEEFFGVKKLNHYSAEV